MKVLKKHDKAQEHMKRALELAQSLYPVPVTQEWYKVNPAQPILSTGNSFNVQVLGP